MKIICKKGCNVKSALQIVSEYMEKKSLEYPLIGEDLEIEISLKNQDGEEYPDNDQTVYFDEKELELLQSHEKTPDYYNIDALTGLYNRGKYERDIRMFQATGYERLTCVYMDVVGLHEVNNHLGHEAGDKMLCMISDAIREYFPKSLAYRIGGDEFVVLLQEAGTGEQAGARLEQIRQKLQHLHQPPAALTGISCSIGCAFFPAQGTTYRQLFLKADAALIQAKRQGKNSCVFY